MPRHPSLKRSPKEYMVEEEDLFRRELETYLLHLSSLIDGLQGGADSNSSLYSKRESYKLPLGTTTLT